MFIFKGLVASFAPGSRKHRTGTIVSVRSRDELPGTRARSEPQMGWHTLRAITWNPAGSGICVPATDRKPMNEPQV